MAQYPNPPPHAPGWALEWYFGGTFLIMHNFQQTTLVLFNTEMSAVLFSDFLVNPIDFP